MPSKNFIIHCIYIQLPILLLNIWISYGKEEEAVPVPGVTYYNVTDTLHLKCLKDKDRPEDDNDITNYEWTIGIGGNAKVYDEEKIKFFKDTYDLGPKKGDLKYLKLPDWDEILPVACKMTIEGVEQEGNKYDLHQKKLPTVKMMVDGSEVEEKVDLKAKVWTEFECLAEGGVPIPSSLSLQLDGDPETAVVNKEESVSTKVLLKPTHHSQNATCEVRYLDQVFTRSLYLNVLFAPVVIPLSGESEKEAAVGESFSRTFAFRSNPGDTNFSCASTTEPPRYSVTKDDKISENSNDSAFLTQYTLTIKEVEEKDFESCIQCEARNTEGSTALDVCLNNDRISSTVLYWVIGVILVVGGVVILVVIVIKFKRLHEELKSRFSSSYGPTTPTVELADKCDL